MRLPRHVKKAATDAFKHNELLALISAEDREDAAKYYAEVAGRTLGTKSDLARIYNLERARFLRGEVQRIAATAVEFAAEIGYKGPALGGNDV